MSAILAASKQADRKVRPKITLNIYGSLNLTGCSCVKRMDVEVGELRSNLGDLAVVKECRKISIMKGDYI